ncbi:TIGR00245 family protein [Allomyces macrogynus ATCC 38327]|uniref:TIGR00245 family protein n=1 Tax=Allomyces macrogynus (strain ATCC 38327) TaxID=578462 RepID=A0A0L0STH5_ALLM3|nr:TIGR00245 family protein [Allomyces macrogynus ATCC 38327]|eukprot:KNE65833.1 TIGR00245 family protein [Allomyces macrogynus ATCC 38327]
MLNNTTLPATGPGGGGNVGGDLNLHLGWGNVGYASILLGMQIVLSWLFELDLGWSILISGIRCVAQLQVMGLVLQPVFANSENPFIVLGLTSVLLLLGAGETFNKSKYGYPGLFPIIVLSMLTGGIVSCAIGMPLALGNKPWYHGQTFIPSVGMILGNGISGVALGIRSCLTAFKDHRDFTEVLLAYGASRWEAARPVVRDALKTALLPQLNNMAVMGLISIPGQMTGQILAGAPIDAAVHFQQVLMFMIVTSTAIATLLAVLFTTFVVIDGHLRIRTDQINMDPAAGMQAMHDIGARIARGLCAARDAVVRSCCGCCFQEQEREPVPDVLDEEETPLL